MRNRFNLSVAEVGGQDTWQLAVLGLAAAGSDAVTVRGVLEKAATFIEDLHLAEVGSFDVEVLHLPHHEVPWEEGDEADGASEDD